MVFIKFLLFSGVVPALLCFMMLLGTVIGDSMRGVRWPLQILAFPISYSISHWLIVGMPTTWPPDIIGWLILLAPLSMIPDGLSIQKGETGFSLFMFIVLAGCSLGLIFYFGPSQPWSFWQALAFGVLWVLHFLASRWYHEFSERIMAWPFFLANALAFLGLSILLMMVGRLDLAQLAGAIVSILIVAMIVTQRQSAIFAQAFALHFLVLIGFALFLLSFFMTDISLVSLLLLITPILALPFLEIFSVTSRGRQLLILGGIVGSVILSVLLQFFQ